jgi:hypothetical protein
MLYLLRELADAGVLPEIRACLRYPHPKVQQEALRTCLFFRDEQVTPFLLQALDGKSPAELISSINLASLSQDPRVIDRLLALLQSGTLFDYQLEVKRAVVRALAGSAPARALPVLAGLLEERGLLQARARDALKLEIVAALEKFPPAAAGGLLQAQARSGSAEVARAAQIALRKLAGGGDR